MSTNYFFEIALNCDAEMNSFGPAYHKELLQCSKIGDFALVFEYNWYINCLYIK